MAYYGNYHDIPKDGEGYSNNCVNGKCSNCGECCADILPLTDAEVDRLKRYAVAHRLKEHRQAPFFDQNATDLTCPFRNQATRSCDVYPVRPLICRAFICTKSLQDARYDRDLIHQSRPPRSLKYEVFGNAESLSFIRMVLAQAIGI